MYLLASIDEGRWLNDREDDQKNIAIRVGKWSQSIILLLASGVPKSEVDHSTINLDRCRIVIKDCGHVLSWKLILCIAE